MKKTKSLQQPLTDFEKLQKLLENKFEAFDKHIKGLEYAQKLSDQKNSNSFKDIRYSIMTEAVKTRRELEENLRAEIQVGNAELRTELNKRITYIADLITVQLGKKTQDHEKRLKKLEGIRIGNN